MLTPNPKVVRGKKYVHHTALDDLSTAEQRQVFYAEQATGVTDWDIVRVSPSGDVMLGRTTSWRRSNPELLESWLVRDSDVIHRRYRAGSRPKYHKTSLMLPNPGVGRGGTAIARTGPSAPARFLYDEGLIAGPVLDFGSGFGADASWLRKRGFQVAEYDPNFEGVERLPRGTYETVLCTYVLNVLPKSHEAKLLRKVRSKLRPGGEAFVTVRRDVDRAGETSRGYQRPVKLNADQVSGAPSGARIYAIGKTSS